MIRFTGRTLLRSTLTRGLGCLILGLAIGQPALAQNSSDGTTSTVEQPSFVTPPSPVLRPEEEMKTFHLAPGYRLELIAADPVVQDPVAMTFDPDGRIWVCEMRGFMPDIDGTGEDASIGVVSVLDDTDGDGIMDKSTPFVEGLVLPRGLCWTVDGMLVCENGTIWLCKDVDGDDRCDEKLVVCKYNPGNLEHALNGLMPAIDNWIYNAKEGIRLRRVNGQWVADTYAARGQWGITQDDHGYLYYNVNASLLRGDLVPCYSSIAQSNNPLVDAQLYDEQVMYPIRPTPGINRGYIPGFLRPDGSLVEANSNCGPVVYRGDNLPSELRGNVFICEPAGNLIRRQVVVEKDGKKSSGNAYEEKEFMASTDERFRPVNMYNSPDGTIAVVDMYRGIIQHGAFITPYLREQILSRELDKAIHLGRIYRIVHESTQPREPIALTKLSTSDLIAQLSSSNGWNRDMAQQILVQRGDSTNLETLRELASSGVNPLARLHALWTLEGLNKLDPDLLFELLSDEDANVRASAVSLYRVFLPIETMVSTVVEDLSTVADDEDLNVRLQLVTTLGLIDSPKADTVLEPILKAASQDERMLAGILGGFADRQTEFLSARLNQSGWTQQETWREQLLGLAAGVMWRQREPMAVLRFCHLLSSLRPDQSWQQIALLEGVKDPPPAPPRRRFPPANPPVTIPASNAAASNVRDDGNLSSGARSVVPGSNAAGGNRVGGGLGRGRPATVTLASAPEGLDELSKSSNERLSAAVNAFSQKLIWPGKDGKPLPVKRSLTPDQQRLYDIGKFEYATVCAGCHHAAGYGLSAKGPPLLGSDWLDSESRLIRVVLNGVQGPITVNETLFNSDNRLSMPGMQKLLDDEKIAGVLTYVRREMVDDAPPVAVSTVASMRDVLGSREEPWTEAELMELPR